MVQKFSISAHPERRYHNGSLVRKCKISKKFLENIQSSITFCVEFRYINVQHSKQVRRSIFDIVNRYHSSWNQVENLPSLFRMTIEHTFKLGNEAKSSLEIPRIILSLRKYPIDDIFESNYLRFSDHIRLNSAQKLILDCRFSRNFEEISHLRTSDLLRYLCSGWSEIENFCISRCTIDH
jgi:hypothetical protein